jgi:hypothetical protein
MGIVIRYAISFGVAGAPVVSASNDAFGGEFVIDADVSVLMTAGESADSFTAELFDLPAPAAERLRAAHKEATASAPLEATISLGYFDDPGARERPVMRGVVRKVVTAVDRSGRLITSVEGIERAGHRLLTATTKYHAEGTVPRDTAIADVLKAAGLKAQGTVGGDVVDFTAQSSAFEALKELVGQADAPLVVRDGQVFVGSGVGGEEFGTLSADRHIIKLDPVHEVRPKPDQAAQPGSQPQVEQVTTFDLQLLGLPDLRVGHVLKIEPRNPVDRVTAPLRVHQLAHLFSIERGYTCRATLVVADTGVRVEASRGAARVVEWVREAATAAGNERPAIDVGEVRAYKDGAGGDHTADLAYAQSPPATAVAPSVAEPVNDQPELHAKPVASPFAWDRCGLVVPVYPSMRALLAHNRGLVNDAVVAGFLWADNPQHRRPESKPGDYWLCLPTKLVNDLPDGEGANDLTSADGSRTIEVKGLRVVVGDGNRTEVGKRPELPKPKTISIAHDSKTTITVSDNGEVAITTDGKDVTIDAGGGKLTLKASKVEVK